MKKNFSKKKLSAQHLIRITEIFKKNKWYIEDSVEQENSQFNRYCKRILDLGENKSRELVLELTERYLWLQVKQYPKYLIDAVSRFVNTDCRISKTTKIYVFPLIMPLDEGKTKSSVMLTYLFNDVELRYDKRLSGYKFEILSDKYKIKDYLSDNNSVLLLVDDYIGTGETAEKCINSLLDLGIKIERLAVLSLVAQEFGLSHLAECGIPVFTSIVRKKGISDYYVGDSLEQNIKIMQKIETKLSIKEKYKFGYGKSEALVTMCRTPNNTFPIFWEESNNMNTAPFPRH